MPIQKKKTELIIIENERPLCTSLTVAETFNRRHADVLKTIETLGCSQEFRERNFSLSSYVSEQNKKQPMYLMAKDGFVLLAMGFTGAKAMEFKELYIRKFNEMESFITSKRFAKCEFPELTDNIKALHDEPKNYHYSNELDMINRIVLGCSAKEFKVAHNINEAESSIRPFLSAKQIELIQKLQKADIGMLLCEPDFYKRKNSLKLYYNRLIGIKELQE